AWGRVRDLRPEEGRLDLLAGDTNRAEGRDQLADGAPAKDVDRVEDEVEAELTQLRPVDLGHGHADLDLLAVADAHRIDQLERADDALRSLQGDRHVLGTVHRAGEDHAGRAIRP